MYYALKQRDAKLEVQEHEVSVTYGAYRPAEDDTVNWRIGHFLMPFYTQNAPGILGRRVAVGFWVPIDDEHTMAWFVAAPGSSQNASTGKGPKLSMKAFWTGLARAL